METRWIRRLGPGIAVLGAMAAIASTVAGAPPPSWQPPGCSGPPAVGPPGSGTWFRLDPTVVDGTYVGQRLSLGSGSAPERGIDLAAESFAAGPMGGAVLVGSDDGRRTQLSLVDVTGGCAWAIGSSTDVVRGGIVSSDGRSIVESRVDRRTRADLGVWRRRLDGTPPVRLLAPIGVDDRFGPTWLTDLAWGDDGETLVVASCGEAACRYRLVPPSGGPVLSIADPELGALVGQADDRLVVREACRGLPCPIVSVGVRSGDRAVLADTAGQAVMARQSGQPVVVYESDADGSRLATITPDGGAPRIVAGPPPGLRLVSATRWSGDAAEHPADRLVFGPDGRLPVDGSQPAILRDVAGNVTVALDEVLP
ncbi:MAG TPA: hypothetical protein VFM38_15810 [Candidatus Limnocylindrales bacterium]|nr:hypothetical protein [Candidatus Limnocylindrales bacterium]